MARSDIWRFQRHADKARELATVTSGITSYFGSAARDRSYQVTWGPIANTYGGTDIKRKRVILNPALLDKVSPEAPFTGEAVDLMQGVAAHEAGHAVIAETHGRDGYEGIIGNVVEDLMIDGPAFAAYNPGLAVETAHLREEMADEFMPPIDEFWRSGPVPATGSQLLSSWACARLFRAPLPRVAHRKFENRYADLLDVVGDELFALDDFTGYKAQAARRNAIEQVRAILEAYERDPQKPQPQPEPEDEGDGEDGEGDGDGSTGDGVPGESEAPSVGGGQDWDSGDDSDDSDGDPSPGKGKGSDDAEGENGLSSGGEGDESEDGDEGDSASGEGDEGEGEGDESDSETPAPGTGAGSASKRKTPADWDATLPEVCPSKFEGASEEATDPEFWAQVQRELEALDISHASVQGKVHLAKYTDKRTVAGVRSAYAQLASEPTRQRHHDSGRVDRRALARATRDEDVFTHQRDKALAGSVVMILDLSGSVRGHEPLLKTSAASVYEALAKTDLKVWVYSYGSPNVAELATPRKVHPVFDRIQAGGGTPTAQAFAAVLKDVRADRTGSNVIIHITDGVADNVPEAQKQMVAANRLGWKVINIGVKTGHLPYVAVSDSVQYISDYTKLPTLMAAAVKDIVAGHKRKMSV